MLVSVVIPCYNADRWVAEAIESCLAQTHKDIEIVVIDDGSTDRSWEKIQSFGKRIIAETGPNRGGGAARNRGFALSTGDYIQFLDADDLLLPEKIERQLAFALEEGADAVYGDWRHQNHLPDGRIELAEISVSAKQEDVLESLLGGWWVANIALLFRRDLVEKTGGWDEDLRAAQDRDFFIRAAMVAEKIAHLSRCDSHYRRYGNVTVSTSNLLQWLESGVKVNENAESALRSQDKLTPALASALARTYFSYARNFYSLDRGVYDSLIRKVFSLDPAFTPNETPAYNKCFKLFGPHAADRFAAWKKKIAGPRAKK